MGVVHKLKQDIVSFLIDYKKKNPSISVRQLATITSEKFQTRVSKSSVNNVLKDATLSSSIGRRATYKEKEEKFSIPIDKKKEISENMHDLGFVKDKALPVEKIDKQEKEEEKGADRKDQAFKKEIKKEEIEQEKDLPLMPDLLDGGQPPPSGVQTRDAKEVPAEREEVNQDFDKHVEQVRYQKSNQRIPVSNGLGFIFLKAAQWEISSRSLMWRIFKKHFKNAASEHFDAAGDTFLFFKFLGVDSYEGIESYKNHGAWILNKERVVSDDKKSVLELQEIFKWCENVQNAPSSENFVMEYCLEKRHMFSEATDFKIYLEDGSEMLMDIAMTTMGSAVGPACFPINKALTWLSNFLISNVESLVFHGISGEKNFDRTFYDMVAVFENSKEKKIAKISVLNADNAELAEFSVIPFQKRNFIVGISPQQNEFEELTKSVKWAGKKPFYHSGTDEVIYFTETKSDHVSRQISEKAKEFRVITVWKDKEGQPIWAILTNQMAGDGSEILNKYITRWPYFWKSEDGTLNQSKRRTEEMQNNQSVKEFSDIFTDYAQSLQGYCKRHFFQKSDFEKNVNRFMQAIYGVSGYYYETEDSIMVSFDVPESEAYREDLVHAVRCVNKSHIFDYHGRRLWLEI